MRNGAKCATIYDMETETTTRTAGHNIAVGDDPASAGCELCGAGLPSSVHAVEFGRALCAECCHYEARRSVGACCQAFGY